VLKVLSKEITTNQQHCCDFFWKRSLRTFCSCIVKYGVAKRKACGNSSPAFTGQKVSHVPFKKRHRIAGIKAQQKPAVGWMQLRLRRFWSLR
jgi:hypothetical protein